MEEKILRHFDLSSQYGVCYFNLSKIIRLRKSHLMPGHSVQPSIGIARVKRWRRANMLKLNPPIEVLTVLLKGKNVKERAYIDELLS